MYNPIHTSFALGPCASRPHSRLAWSTTLTLRVRPSPHRQHDLRHTQVAQLMVDSRSHRPMQCPRFTFTFCLPRAPQAYALYVYKRTAAHTNCDTDHNADSILRLAKPTALERLKEFFSINSELSRGHCPRLRMSSRLHLILHYHASWHTCPKRKSPSPDNYDRSECTARVPIGQQAHDTC